MPAVFPSSEWLTALQDKLNSDGRYGEIARHWEGDLLFDIPPEGSLQRSLGMYLDLWHGVCRDVNYAPDPERYLNPKFMLPSPYDNFTSILLGKLDPMTAIMTSKLVIKGSLGYMRRNVPTVLDFVRGARAITSEIL